MSGFSVAWRDRLRRLGFMCGSVSMTGSGCDSVARLIGVTSSRLGHDAALRARACGFLRRSLMECRQSGSELLIACGSAIEPWARRGAELYGVHCRELQLNTSGSPSAITITTQDSSHCSVDAALIALADQLDAVYVRRGGRIAQCLSNRLQIDTSASIRVALTRTKYCAAQQLMMSGAVGWIEPGIEPPIENTPRLPKTFTAFRIDDPTDPAWAESAGHWLVHCTRAPCGRWPGETERQYLDSMLLGSPASAQRTPLDSLARIIRIGRLIAGARTSRHEYPVVCFSSRSLRDLLTRRRFRSHISRWDYEPFGIAIRTVTARRLGIKPVIYGDPTDRGTVPKEDQFRFHPRGTRHNWTEEGEWRADRSVDLFTLDRRDVRVFAFDSDESRSVLSECPWTVSFLSSQSPHSIRSPHIQSANPPRVSDES